LGCDALPETALLFPAMLGAPVCLLGVNSCSFRQEIGSQLHPKVGGPLHLPPVVLADAGVENVNSKPEPA
jgi:hypothetical protein